MNTLKLFFILIVTSLLVACNNDDDDSGLIISGNLIHYDGPNSTGPILTAGTYEAAAQFFGSDLDGQKNKELVDVRWFMGVLPVACAVKVYGPGPGDQPGSLIYEANVTNDLQVGWNSHQLSTTIPITGENLWISIVFGLNSQQQSIGCDAGPNRKGGDWLFMSSDNTWTPYRDRTPESINWNNRGVLE